MRILITGGLGTIGSCLTAKLKKQGHKITVYDNMEIGHLDNLKIYLSAPEIAEIGLIEKDILDKEQLTVAVGAADMVYHLAATLGTLNVVSQPSRMLNVNSLGTHAVCDLCVSYNIPLVLMSTSMVYGKNPKMSVSEKDDLFVKGNIDVGLWWYAISKMADEAYANSLLLENKRAKILIIRPFNVIAPLQSSAAGFVFPRFFRSAYLNEPLLVYGDGKQKRTFTWASDFVDSLLNLIENDVFRTTVNIGGTESISISDLAVCIIKATDSSSIIKHIDPQELFSGQFDEIDQRSPDVSFLRSLTGFVPETSINEMVMEFSLYYKNHFKIDDKGLSHY